MTALPLVSIVIPNFDGAHLLETCLKAVQAQRGPSFETILVDNGSTDESVDVARRSLPPGAVVALDRNCGFAVAANAGARRARGRFVAFLNNDAEPRPDWLAELVACLGRHPRAAAATPKILRRDEPALLDGAGDALTRSLKAYRRGAGEADDGRFDHEERVVAASGTAALWRRSAFLELGGFDEDFFAYYEDVDLGLRAWLAGFETWYVPTAVAVHRGGATSHVAARQFEFFYGVRNRWLMIVKSVPPAWVVRNIHLLVLGEALSLGRSILHGGGGRHLAAYASLVRMFPRALRARRAGRPSESRHIAAAAGLVDRRFPPLSSALSRRRRGDRPSRLLSA